MQLHRMAAGDDFWTVVYAAFKGKEPVASLRMTLVDALASDSPERRRARSEAMRSETWEHKVACVGEHVSRVQRDRQARPSTGRR